MQNTCYIVNLIFLLLLEINFFLKIFNNNIVENEEKEKLNLFVNHFLNLQSFCCYIIVC